MFLLENILVNNNPFGGVYKSLALMGFIIFIRSMDCFKIFKGQFTGTHSFLFDANTLWKKSQFANWNMTIFKR